MAVAAVMSAAVESGRSGRLGKRAAIRCWLCNVGLAVGLRPKEGTEGGHFCHGSIGPDKSHDLRVCARIDVPPEPHSGQPELATVLRASRNLSSTGWRR